MSSATNGNDLDRQLTLQGIPAPRKHAYFYAVLCLGTIVMHNAWTRLQESSAPAPMEQMATELSDLSSTAERLIP